MLKIWGRANSINVQKVLWLADELNLNYERIDAGLQFGVNDQPWFSSVNPNRTIPTIDDNGFILWESNVIVRYLAKRYGTSDFYLADLRQEALMEQWMDWQQTTVMLDLGPLFLNLIRTPEEQQEKALIERTSQQMIRHMAILNTHLSDRDYILGSSMTAADIPPGAAVYRWYALDVEHSDFPALNAWYERLQTPDAYSHHIMQPLS